MDGRLGDEVMTNVTASRRYLKRLRTATHLYKVLMRHQELGCILVPDLLDSDDGSGQESDRSLCLQRHNPDSFHNQQSQALLVQRTCLGSRVPGPSLRHVIRTNDKDE